MDGSPFLAALGVETIVLAAEPGTAASEREPVRIFVGTEPAQARAERAFLFSIERVRDPARRYEISLMKELPGFRRWRWNTGFTNYRFAVPELAGFRGRAIYNDVDQIYLADPAELFDLPLGGHGYLAVSATDTSVMLVDCARMARFFTLARARRRTKYALIDEAASTPGTVGALPPEWNARDEEYRPGRSKLLHYTTIHKQPWHPFPERFHYQPNAAADVWLALERAADDAGYHPFTAARPTRRFAALARGGEAVLPAAAGSAIDEAVGRLARRTGARSLLQLVPGHAAPAPAPNAFGAGPGDVDRAGLFAEPPDGARYDGVVCGVRLDALPPEDLAHVVDGLFARADRFVLAAVRCDPPARRRRLAPPRGTVGQPASWEWLFRTVAHRHPGVHWEVAYVRARPRRRSAPGFHAAPARGRASDAPSVRFLHGGPFPDALRDPEALPRVWVLADHKPGHTTQSEGLVAELGWPVERIDLEFNAAAELPNAWTRGTRRSLAREPVSDAAVRGHARLAPPWPDLVIATGRRTAPIASWIRRQSGDRTRTVQMGRIGAFQNDEFDLAVAPAYACLFPDERRIETAAPVTRVSPSALLAASERWSAALASAPAPRIALLVGGNDPEHVFPVECARRLGADVAELARREGGSVLATTSRRTPPRSAAALRAALGDACAQFHEWGDGARVENPYLGFLAIADAVVVTGESASMLAEACATGKPVYIYPLPERRAGPRTWLLRAERWLADAVTARAYARPTSRRGIERPQRGLEHLCAALLARGFVRSSGHSRRLHDALVARGLAKRFDGKLAPIPSDHLTDVERVAERVRALFGRPGGAPAPRV